MARAKQTVSKVKTRVNKNGSANKSGYMRCNVCGGTGVQKKPSHKKK
jgi:hypothetical protein